VIAVYYALGGALPKWSIWALVALAFFAAAFRAWREERKQGKQELAGQNTAILNERESHKRAVSDLDFRIKFSEAQINSLTKRTPRSSLRSMKRKKEHAQGAIFQNAFLDWRNE
jgi:hypothetical protein